MLLKVLLTKSGTKHGFSMFYTFCLNNNANVVWKYCPKTVLDTLGSSGQNIFKSILVRAMHFHSWTATNLVLLLIWIL